MKRVLLFYLAMTAIVTACDPDWAMNPKNQGYAYILVHERVHVNKKYGNLSKNM